MMDDLQCGLVNNIKFDETFFPSALYFLFKKITILVNSSKL